MPVFLRRPDDLPAPDLVAWWFPVADQSTPLDFPPEKRLPDLAARLETTFDLIRTDWWSLGRALGRDHPSARWSHTAAAGTYGSDFGLMLAWARLTESCAREPETTLVVCSDPWLFRHLATLPGVHAGRPPYLWPERIRRGVRGLMARLAVTVRTAHTAGALRRDRRKIAGNGGPALVVYGHTSSEPSGEDAYFGDLMNEMPTLVRLLHTDCRLGPAQRLSAGNRTVSLNAWGRISFALTRLPFTAWKPSRHMSTGKYGWLIQRAAARENGGGGPAMNRWQMHCQRQWLKDKRPDVVAWPWENHAWERDLVRAARHTGVRTVGYQHAVVGRHQFNFAPASNPDGLDSIPDDIACNGPGYRDQLADLDIPKSRLTIAGAFRVGRIEGRRFDPLGPVYVALSAIPKLAQHMMRAIRSVASATGVRFVIKDHPMYPFAFNETENIRRIGTTIPKTHGIAAVIYSTGTPGLEGMFAGVPTFRLMPEDMVALDIMPDGVAAQPVTMDGLAAALASTPPGPSPKWEDIMAPVDLETWRRLLGTRRDRVLENSATTMERKNP